MEFTALMSPADLTRTHLDVDGFNKALNSGKPFRATLDKDDFLKILLAQLQHQDPTNPMEDREFIAQMAQFSSLEQMTNMGREFSKVASMLRLGEAQGMLGRRVEISTGQSTITGSVTQVMRGDFPMVMVNGTFYDLEQVSKVIE
ncbi:MAG TPA: flagellar hook assembly protein FlgD [Magnetospirillaceae bacterium]|nr:flagellar hook assembly protein FlgD [Magnetospirillaceae bacterium]